MTEIDMNLIKYFDNHLLFRGQIDFDVSFYYKLI
jgi:hypothetical protein